MSDSSIQTILNRLDKMENGIHERLSSLEKQVSELNTSMDKVLDCVSHENADKFPAVNGQKKRLAAK